MHVVSKTARARCRHDSSDCMQHLLIRLISSFRPIGHQCTSGKALGMHAVSLRSSHLIFPSTYPSMSCAGSLQGTFVPQLSPPPSSLISMARARTDSCTLSARRLVHVVGMTASACYRHGSSRINLAVRRRSPRTIGQVTHVSGRGPSAHSAPQRAAASDLFAPRAEPAECMQCLLVRLVLSFLSIGHLCCSRGEQHPPLANGALRSTAGSSPLVRAVDSRQKTQLS